MVLLAAMAMEELLVAVLLPLALEAALEVTVVRPEAVLGVLEEAMVAADPVRLGVEWVVLAEETEEPQALVRLEL